MKPLDVSSQHDWMDARVEAYVDDDLPSDERAAFEQVLANTPYWAAQVEQARKIRDALHALPLPTCPPEVTRTVLDETRRRQALSGWEAWWQRVKQELDIEWRAGWQPALATLALIAIVVGSALFSEPAAPGRALTQQSMLTAPYSPAEVEQAEAKAKWALAYVAHVGQRTGDTIEHEVLQEHIAAPMRRALQPLAPSSSLSSTNR